MQQTETSNTSEECIFSKNRNQGFEINNPSENYICQSSTSLLSQGSEQLNSIYTHFAEVYRHLLFDTCSSNCLSNISPFNTFLHPLYCAFYCSKHFFVYILLCAEFICDTSSMSLFCL